MKHRRKKRTIAELMNKGWRTIYKYGKECVILEKGKYRILYDVKKYRVIATYKSKSILIGC